MTRYLSIYYLLLFSLNVSAQEQVSDIINIEQQDLTPCRFFANLEGIEYIIEANTDTIYISTITQDKIERIHTIASTSPSQNNVQIIIQENQPFFFAIYNDIIKKIAFESGDVFEEISFSDYIHGQVLKKTILREYIVYLIKVNDTFEYLSLNLNSGEITIIDSLKNTGVFFSGSHLYTANEEGTALRVINLANPTEESNIVIPLGIKKIYSKFFSSESQLVVTSSNNTIYHISGSNILSTCHCFENIEAPVANIYFSDNLIYYAYKDDSDTLFLDIRDPSTCQEKLSRKTENASFQYLFMNLKKWADNKVIIYSIKNSEYSNESSMWLFNENTNDFILIPILVDYVIFTNSFKIDETLYFITSYEQSYDTTPEKACYGLNLNTLKLSKVPFYDLAYTVDLIMGSQRSDKTINFLSLSSEGEKDFWNYNPTNSKSNKIDHHVYKNINTGFKKFDVKRNTGQVIALDDPNGLYVTKANFTTKISNAQITSNIKHYNNFIHAIISENDSIYHIKINESTLEFNKNLIDLGVIKNTDQATDFAIINFGNNYSIKNKYLDLKTDEYKTLNLKNSNSDWHTALSISKNNVIVRDRFENDYYYFMWNTETDQTLEFPLFTDISPRFFSDNIGGFYILDGKIDDGDVKSRKVQHIDFNGTNTTEFDIEYSLPYYNMFYYTNEPLCAIPLPGNDEIIFILSNKSDLKIISVPYDNPLYYQKFKWINVSGAILVESKLNDGYATWYFSMAQDPVNIKTQDINDRIYSIYKLDHRILLLYKNELNNTITIDLFNTIASDMISSNTYKMAINNNQYIKLLGQIDEDEIMLSFNNDEYGTEPYVYNMTDQSLNLLYDLLPGSRGSEPRDFFRLDGHIYFTALTMNDGRQMFRIKDRNGFTSTSIKPPSSLIQLQPNPTVDYINIMEEFTKYQIFNTQGDLLLMGDSNNIDLSSLATGSYTIRILTLDNTLKSGKFIKM